jgi:hypothetical protein
VTKIISSLRGAVSISHFLLAIHISESRICCSVSLHISFITYYTYKIYDSLTGSAKCILTTIFLPLCFTYRLKSTPDLKFFICCSSKFLTIACVSICNSLNYTSLSYTTPYYSCFLFLNPIKSRYLIQTCTSLIFLIKPATNTVLSGFTHHLFRPHIATPYILV